MNAPLPYATRRRITVDQYFREIGETEERYELIDGEVWLMAGGNQRHNRIGVRIVAALFAKLSGRGCEPFGSDMAVQLDDYNFRYPDAALYCDQRDIGPDAGDKQRLDHPKVIFEVLSPSTARLDRARKAAEYRELSSLSALALVDPVNRTIEVHERTGPATWTRREVAAGGDLVLPDPAVTLTAAEIFGEN